MKIESVSQIHFTKTDLKKLDEIFDFAVVPYLNKIGNNNEEEEESNLKLINRVVRGGSYTCSIELRDRLIELLKKTVDVISEKREDVEIKKNHAPVESRGIIQRPRDFFQALVENYTMHIKSITEAAEILTESRPQDFEED